MASSSPPVAWFRKICLGILTGLAATLAAQEAAPSPAPAPPTVDALEPTALETLGRELQRLAPETSVVPSQPTARATRPPALTDPVALEALADPLRPSATGEEEPLPVAFDADSTLADFDALARQITGAARRPVGDFSRQALALNELERADNPLENLFPMSLRTMRSVPPEAVRPDGHTPIPGQIVRSPSTSSLEPILAPITENPFLGDPLAPARQKNPYLSPETPAVDSWVSLVPRPATPAASAPLVPVPTLFPGTSTATNPLPVEEVIKPVERPARTTPPVTVPNWERR